MNLAGFKKLKEDKKMVTMGHPSGHEIKISKKALSAIQRKQLEKLPLHLADGTGDVESSAASAISNFVDQDKGASIPQSDNASAIPQDASGSALLQGGKQDDDKSFAFENASSPSVSLPGPFAPDGAAAVSDDDSNLPKADPNIAGKGAAVGAPSAAPASVITTGGGNPVDLNKAYAQGQQAIKQTQDISTQLSQRAAEADAERIKATQDLETTAQQNLKDFSQHRDDFANYIKSNPINPNHYSENMSTPGKVATAIGLLLGGFSGGLLKTGVNPAADFLNKQIDRDIEGQKSRQDQQKTIFGANQQLYGDQVLANNATRINMNDLYSQKIKQAADQLGTPAAQAAANDALSKLAFSSNEALRANAQHAAVGQAIQNGGAGLNPLTLAKANYIPQEQAIKEQESIDTQNASINNLKTLYGQAAKEANISEIASPASKTRLGTINAGIGDAILRGDINHRVSPETRDAFLAPYQITTRDYLQGTVGTKLQAALDKTKDLAAGTTPYSAKYIPAALPDYSTGLNQPSVHKVGDILKDPKTGANYQITDASGAKKRVQ